MLLIGTSTMIMTVGHREPLAEPGLTIRLREAHYGRSLGGLSRMSVSAGSATRSAGFDGMGNPLRASRMSRVVTSAGAHLGRCTTRSSR